MAETVSDIAEKLLENSTHKVFEGDIAKWTPPLSSRILLDDLDTSWHSLVAEAVQAAKDWSQRRSDGIQDASLVLAGPVGTGKTHIAKAILWSVFNVLDDGTPISPVGRFYTADEIVQALAPQRQAEAGVIAATHMFSLVPPNCPMVVIDDVGSEQNIPFIGANGQADEISRRYFKIVDYCYGNKDRKTSVIMTSNLSLPELERHLGRRAWSRLNEMAPAGFIMDLGGVPDYRMKRSGR